ncbi:MAG: hypothetical protein CMJ24_08740 [Phycisphaerae bacterium]|nr:hypothetical protein [Phycisphaerae bacterium]
MHCTGRLKRNGGSSNEEPPESLSRVPCGTDYFLPDMGHPPQLADLDSSIAPRLDCFAAGIIFLPALGQQLDFWLQEGALSVAPRLGLAAGIILALLAVLLHCDLHADAHEDAQEGVSSAALRLGLAVVPLLAQPAMARTRLIPRVLRMSFIVVLQSSYLSKPGMSEHRLLVIY